MQLTTLDIKRIRKLRYQDGLTGHATARIIGCSSRTVLHYAPGRPGKVPNDKLRAAFLESGLTATELARRMNWVYPVEGRMKANGAAMKRTLGLLPDRNRHHGGQPFYWSMIDAETCGVIAEAMGLAAWEVMPDETKERLTG